MTKTKNTAKKSPAKTAKGKVRPPKEPGHHDLIREPDVTAAATIRFTCAVYIQVTHPDYMPHEVMALIKQGQVQLDPIPPGQVGALILNGFPYTVLGHYTFADQDAEYEEAPSEVVFHGPFYEFYRHKAATIQGMVNASGEEFEKDRQETRELRENMTTIMTKRQKRRQQRRKGQKS